MLKTGERLEGSDGKCWEVVQWRGSGTCCEVYEVNMLGFKHNKAAVKVYKEGLNFKSALDREAMSLKLVSQFSGPCPQLVTHYSQIQHAEKQCLVQQLLDDNIRQVMQASPSGALSLHVLHKFLADIMRGLYVLHGSSFIHADLKPDNLLWSAQDGCLKIIDFSLTFQDNDKVIGIIQSQGYRAPEVTSWNANRQKQFQRCKELKSISPDSFAPAPQEVKPCSACDMWSAGCLLVEMFSGNKLFSLSRIKEVAPKINPGDSSQLTSAVIFKLVDEAFSQREVDSVSLPFVLKLKDLAIRLLNPNPGLRLSACEALLHPALTSACPPPCHADLLLLSSPILRFMNLIDDLTDANAVTDIEEDVHDMCSNFGNVLQCFACKSDQGLGKIFVHFSYAHQARAAFHALCKKTYNHHSIIITYFPLGAWHRHQLF